MQQSGASNEKLSGSMRHGQHRTIFNDDFLRVLTGAILSLNDDDNENHYALWEMSELDRPLKNTRTVFATVVGISSLICVSYMNFRIAI